MQQRAAQRPQCTRLLSDAGRDLLEGSLRWALPTAANSWKYVPPSSPASQTSSEVPFALAPNDRLLTRRVNSCKSRTRSSSSEASPYPWAVAAKQKQQSSMQPTGRVLVTLRAGDSRLLLPGIAALVEEVLTCCDLSSPGPLLSALAFRRHRVRALCFLSSAKISTCPGTHPSHSHRNHRRPF